MQEINKLPWVFPFSNDRNKWFLIFDLHEGGSGLAKKYYIYHFYLQEGGSGLAGTSYITTRGLALKGPTHNFPPYIY